MNPRRNGVERQRVSPYFECPTSDVASQQAPSEPEPVTERTPGASTESASGTAQRLTGIVHSYIEGKDYCFLKGEHDRQSYFLHRNAVRDPGDQQFLRMGALVEFTPAAGPKGLVATKARVANPTDMLLKEPTSFVVSKNELKRGRVIRACPTIRVETRSGPDKAKEILIETCKDMGANAVLMATYDRYTGSSGNYRYTVHTYSGKPAIVADEQPSFDRDAISRSVRTMNQRALDLEAGYQAYLEMLKKERFRAIVRLIVLLVCAALILGYCSTIL